VLDLAGNKMSVPRSDLAVSPMKGASGANELGLATACRVAENGFDVYSDAIMSGARPTGDLRLEEVRRLRQGRAVEYQDSSSLWPARVDRP
jgi:hypothetical protein